MRWQILLTLLAIVLFTTAGLLYSASRRSQVDPQNAKNLIWAFQKSYKSSLSVSADLLDNLMASKNLVTTEGQLPGYHKYWYSSIRQLEQYRQTCIKKHLRGILDKRLDKAKLWLSFVCGHKDKLSKDFFTKPPYMLPWGQSFAAAALVTGDVPFTNTDWQKQHQQYFHLLELRNQPVNLLSGVRLMVSRMSPDEIRGFLDNSALFAGAKFLWLLSDAEQGDVSQRQYLRYSLSDWNEFFASKEARPILGKTNGCDFKALNLCWQKLSHKEIAATRFWPFFAILASLVLFAQSIFLLFQKWYLLNSSRFNRKLMVRTLAHELRSPLTSMLLNMELLNNQFDRLDSGGQRSLLRLKDDLARMNRLVKVSQKYIASDSEVRLNPQKINSAVCFLEQVKQNFPASIVLAEELLDFDFIADKEWLELSIGNLVSNAIEHGKPPIILGAEKTVRGITIFVQDSGKGLPSDLKLMKIPFRKDNSSKGLGLGLNMVDQMVKKMGGTLNYKPKPTTFSIILRG